MQEQTTILTLGWRQNSEDLFWYNGSIFFFFAAIVLLPLLQCLSLSIAILSLYTCLYY